jgi:NADPH-dependent 2,4-dienoyl-CoA reductase/sulfur reductase-like enzyme
VALFGAGGHHRADVLTAAFEPDAGAGGERVVEAGMAEVRVEQRRAQVRGQPDGVQGQRLAVREAEPLEAGGEAAGVFTGGSLLFGSAGRTDLLGAGHAATLARAGTKETVDYDILHAVPPQSAPDWLKATPLADTTSPFGYVKVDSRTLQSPDWPTVFALGDASNLPTSKTGAAARKQAVVLVKNLVAPLRHVAAQAVRAAGPLLERHAQGPPGLTRGEPPAAVRGSLSSVNAGSRAE